MRGFLLSLFLSVAWTALPAQRYDANWPLGIDEYPDLPAYGNAIIRFLPDSIQVVEVDLHMNFEITAAAISDSSGNLLFYTNGCHVANASGDTLAGGGELNPGAVRDWVCPHHGYVSPLGAMFLPAPDDPDNYFYLLHMGMQYAANGGWSYGPLYFSIVDKNGNNGQGAILSSNSILQQGATLEPFSVVRHGNGRDWWILVPGYGGNLYHRFLLSPTGIADKGEMAVGPSAACTRIGSSAFSPQGNKLARTQNCRTVVFDFDRCTGQISNPIEMNRPDYVFGGGGVAFDSSGRYLFVSEQLAVLRADLNGPNPALDTLAGVEETYGAGLHLMQYGPDGKLYFNVLHRSRYMPVLDELGESVPVYNKQGLSLDVYSVRTLPHFPNYRLYDFPDSPCDTLGIDTPVSTHEPGATSKAAVRAYPNPAREFWQLEWRLPPGTGDGELLVFNGMGGLMLRQVAPETHTEASVSLRDWPDGFYVWQLRLKNGERAAEGKFIKM